MENNHLQVMDNQSRIAMVRVGPAHHQEAAPPMQYHLGDHLGSSALVIGGPDAGGRTFINREEFTPYGESSFGSFGRKRYRHNGKERDEESGLSYFGARYFNSYMGRAISTDPIGPSDTLNLYTIYGNSPLNRVDMYGMKSSPATGTTDTQSKPASPHTLSRDGTLTIDATNLFWSKEAPTLYVHPTEQGSGKYPGVTTRPFSELETINGMADQAKKVVLTNMEGVRQFKTYDDALNAASVEALTATIDSPWHYARLNKNVAMASKHEVGGRVIKLPNGRFAVTNLIQGRTIPVQMTSKMSGKMTTDTATFMFDSTLRLLKYEIAASFHTHPPTSYSSKWTLESHGPSGSNGDEGIVIRSGVRYPSYVFVHDGDAYVYGNDRNGRPLGLGFYRREQLGRPQKSVSSPWPG
jgi:RHS repeat-associated protein